MSEDISLFRESPKEVEESLPQPRSLGEPDAVFSDSEMPPSLYREYLRTPYIADLLSANAVYDLPDIRQFSEQADRYILAEVFARDLPDTKESYKKVLEESEKELNLSEGVTLHTKLEKIAELLKIKATISGSIKKLEELKESSNTRLSDKTLKRYLKERHNIAVV